MLSNKAASIEARITGIKGLLQPLIEDATDDEQLRKQLHGLFQGLITTLETPSDAIWRMIMQPAQSACLKTAIDMGLIEALNIRTIPVSAEQLSATTRGDRTLIVRIMRALAATGVIKETGYQTWAATDVSKVLDNEGLKGAFTYMFDASDASLVKMPEFLAKTGYKNPEGSDGIFQQAHDTKAHNFEWTNQDPRRLKAFHAFMGVHRQKRTAWFIAFPVNEILFQNTLFDEFKGREGEVFLVDVAGGAGYDLKNFRLRFPDLRGRLILQDVPEVINGLTDLHEDITPMKYDFFTPQPVKGAIAYYFRTIFHDWPNDKAREILRNTKSAMTSSSKILINEWILPDVGTPVYPALLDIQMMGIHSGMERTETQWRELLKSVGLSAKFHKVDNNSEGLIEAMLLN